MAIGLVNLQQQEALSPLQNAEELFDTFCGGRECIVSRADPLQIGVPSGSDTLAYLRGL